MSDLVGTLKKVTLDGITFNAHADANISETGSKNENSSLATSGRNLRKVLKRPEIRESVVLACNGAEREIIKQLDERLDDFPMSYTTAAGDVYRCSGWIVFESRETEEGRATIQMHPREDWESFLA